VSQINVNAPPPEPVDTAGDRTGAAAINFMTVLIILGVVVALAVLAWYIFASGGFNIVVPVQVDQAPVQQPARP
jgi:hypothetical protein